MRNRRSCLTLAVLAVFICLSLIATTVFALNLPDQVEATFGPPDPALDPARRILYSAMLLWQADDLTQPVDPEGAERAFQVEMGESTPSVIGRLWQEGLIRNPGAFRTYLSYAGLDTSLQAGNYQLSPAMAPLEMAQTLQDATPKEVTFYILSGWRAEEIAAALPTSGMNISQEAFLTAVHSRYPGYTFSAELPSPPSVEGFLFAGEYVLGRDLTARQLVKAFVDRFDSQVSPDLRKGFARQKLTLFQAVTLASMVEREAVLDEEMPMIASVFINRLNVGMKLDSDPTVQYAIGFNKEQNTWWTNPLKLDDLKIDSPYNTYLNTKLPPGPIANPGLEALQAVAFPARTPYFFFRAACDGSGRHLFSKTYDEHIHNECK